MDVCTIGISERNSTCVERFDKTTFFANEVVRTLMSVRQTEKQMRGVITVFEDKISE